MNAVGEDVIVTGAVQQFRCCCFQCDDCSDDEKENSNQKNDNDNAMLDWGDHYQFSICLSIYLSNY